MCGHACAFYNCTFLQNVRFTKWQSCVVTNDPPKPEELRLVQWCFIHAPTHYVGYYYQPKNTIIIIIIIIIILFYFVVSSYRIVTWRLISSLLQCISLILIFLCSTVYINYSIYTNSNDSKDVWFLTVMLLGCQVSWNVTPSRLVHIYRPSNILQPSAFSLQPSALISAVSTFTCYDIRLRF